MFHVEHYLFFLIDTQCSTWNIVEINAEQQLFHVEQ